MPLRTLQPADVPDLLRLSLEAKWNQTAEDWLRFIDLEPEGCFGIEQNGIIVASTTTLRYDRDLAWIGMVLTAEAFRGQGLARRLLEESLAFLDRSGVACIKLDATDLGRPVYAKFGFLDEHPVERWVRAPAPAADAPAIPFQFDAALDRDAFGADRSRLLERLARIESASLEGLGYAMGRPGANAAYFGPCVARELGSARSLVNWFLARHAHEQLFWDLIPDLPHAVGLAREFGFRPARRLVRMRRGKPLATAPDNAPEIYALAGFECG